MRTLWSGFLAVSAAALLSSSPAHALWVTGPLNLGDRDGTSKEGFADAVNNYGDAGSNLGACIPGVQAWRNHLISAGFAVEYATDGDAWSSDYELGGQDNEFNDAADFSYFSGHGSEQTFYFHGAGGDNEVNSSEAFWGELDLEAIAIDACEVLNDYGRSVYSSRGLNDGIHYVLGFHTIAWDVTTTADKYGYYLKNGYTVRAAWTQATKDGGDPSQVGAFVRYYSSSCDTLNDKLNSTSCDPRSGSAATTTIWTL